METMRVLGDEICYRAKDYLSIHKLFATRADLYRTVYTHSKVKDPCEYWKLDDTIIKTIETTPDEELRESRDLILHIRRRNLYQVENFIFEF
ncbi:hypothetical protein ES332_D06G141700v1 [Gossypium tomentosum]|uniref:Uncharacterized protein n=1 Tax=Gossypium tomentosum TaxID=34277 RepID=A0A5D2KIP7_GOSTO|nr:hypothetical protein ES332_D06G141700v1 [Gossypium tomentosum]